MVQTWCGGSSFFFTETWLGIVHGPMPGRCAGAFEQQVRMLQCSLRASHC
jgi:hypothetical protein